MSPRRPSASSSLGSRRLAQRLFGIGASIVLLGGACTDAPEEARTFCDHLAEIDGTGGPLADLSTEDADGLSAAAEALRQASKSAPEDLQSDVQAIANALLELEKNADGQDPVGVANKLRTQHTRLTQASRNVVGHAEQNCGITLGRPTA